MLSGDNNPWRNLGHASWHDPYAILENTSSPEFKHAVQQENELWDQTPKPRVTIWKKQFETFLTTALPHDSEFAHESIQWHNYCVRIQHTFGHRKNVWIYDTSTNTLITHHTSIHACIVDPDPDMFLYCVIKDDSEGGEQLKLFVYDAFHKKPKWTHDNVGPDAVFCGDSIYFQSVENSLRYSTIYAAKKTNGSHRIRIFEETDPKFQVELSRPRLQSDVFIKTYNALAQRLGRVNRTKIQWVTKKPSNDGSGTTLIPISRSMYATNTHLHLQSGVLSYKYPKNSFIVDAMLLTNSEILVCTIKDAACSLYVFHIKSRKYELMYESSTPSQIVLHHQSTQPRITIHTPNKPSRVFEIMNNYRLHTCFEMPCVLELPYFLHGFAGSARVPYTIVSHVKNPKKLIVEGYGAYGIMGSMKYPLHWLPWLSHGYAVAVACPRGGRDKGDDWYDQGRTAQRKNNTFLDTAAVIQTVQKRLRISRDHTIFYGRSAGGWLAAIIGQQHSDLVGAIYAEVPYLDILRTTSNPKLPLTQLEYDEFGNSFERPEDFAALHKISPIDSATLAPQPVSPFLFVRTGLNDVQVLPYEALKWAKKMRGLGWHILVGIDQNGGHFASETTMYDQLAEDAAILDHIIQKKKEIHTRKLRSHKSIGTTRRRKSSKKH